MGRRKCLQCSTHFVDDPWGHTTDWRYGPGVPLYIDCRSRRNAELQRLRIGISDKNSDMRRGFRLEEWSANGDVALEEWNAVEKEHLANSQGFLNSSMHVQYPVQMT